VGKPLKSSLFGKQYGIEALEQMMKKSGEEIKAKGIVADTRAIVSASMTKARTGNEFRADLQKKGIDILLRYGNGGRLFGVTFIDHNSRTVLNGSTLGKEFSANALSARFADFSQPQERREDKQPATVKGYGGDDSPVGILLSVLTPEPGQHDTNEPMPTRKKKKKRRYGRQV
jgi:hypothetical protein